MKVALRLVFALLFTLVIFQSVDNQRKNEVTPAKKISENKHFTIVIPSYNNANYYKKNLDSIFSQDYKNFNVVYIDDSSTDKTYELVKTYLEQHNVLDNVTLIHNSQNQKALYNLYHAIHSLKNDTIVVIVDGDDWLPSNDVLSYLNATYQNPKVWLTYGEYQEFPNDMPGISAPVKRSILKKAKARSIPWKFSHLRTFYAGLFKEIKLEDLMYKGTFFDVGYDMAIMYPMIEMARVHTYYTPKISYIYNHDSPLNDDKVRQDHQLNIAKVIRAQNIYPKLSKHPARIKEVGEKADLIAFSYNRPLQLYSLLESIKTFVEGIDTITVIYRSDDSYDSGYQIVKDAFPNVKYIAQGKTSSEAKKDFKPHVMRSLKKSPSKYVVFAVDDIIVTHQISLSEDIQKLQKTGAEGFYYRLGKNITGSYSLNQIHGIPNLTPVAKECFTWEFKASKGEWDYPHTVDFTLYNKDMVISQFEKISFYHPNSLEGKWAEIPTESRIGLTAPLAKMVNIVSDYNNRFANSFSPEALNEVFLEGKKIDIDAISRVEHNTPHFDIIPTFIQR